MNLQEPTLTGDGSLTLYSERYGEHYHSTRDGALRESLCKHVLPAWSLIDVEQADALTVLDICFGLGYNTLATLYHIERLGVEKPVTICSPELDRSLVESLATFAYPEELKPYTHLLPTLAQTGSVRYQNVQIELFFGDARDYLTSCERVFDIVYQDPFSAKKNPLLWTHEYFRALAARLKPEGLITTYSSATPVRLGMSENGLYIHTPPKSEVRSGTIASRRPLALPRVDMERKKTLNPGVGPLRDADFPPV